MNNHINSHLEFLYSAISALKHAINFKTKQHLFLQVFNYLAQQYRSTEFHNSSFAPSLSRHYLQKMWQFNILVINITFYLYLLRLHFDIYEKYDFWRFKNLNEINVIFDNNCDGCINSRNAGRSRDCRIYDPEENNRASKALSHIYYVHSTLSLLQLQFTTCARVTVFSSALRRGVREFQVRSGSSRSPTHVESRRESVPLVPSLSPVPSLSISSPSFHSVTVCVR